ncbi:uncharacterized protein LOC119745220 [Patiria miniata]|uniref:EGF-like domain-containing protein n=1 Tax=Patiria miniata TaxID=46514 RepID=A0A914BPF4_PATMI|nr:uncharacterized protein LOC119745220 [Patiria miniata]
MPGCALNPDSCENKGEFLKEPCECLCPIGFAGVYCEVSTATNPCVVDPDLCPGKGQYCEADTKVTNGAEYVCKCNIQGGYAASKKEDGTCIEVKTLRSDLHVTKIDGKDAIYKDAYRDVNSADSIKIFEGVKNVMLEALKNNPATERAEDVILISIKNGSLKFDTALVFPKDDDVTENSVKDVLLNDTLGNNYLDVDPDKSTVSEPPPTICPDGFCSNDGTCRQGGTFPDLKPICSCARGFSGTTCGFTELTPFVIAMIAFGGFAALILAMVLVYWLYVRTRRDKGGKVDREDSTFAPAWGSSDDGFVNKGVDSESGDSFESNERMDQLARDLKQSNFLMKRAKSVYQWGSLKHSKAQSQPSSTGTPVMLELRESIADRRWYTASNI